MSLTISALTPRTMLEAVNELLSCVRIAPVMSLIPNDIGSDAADAQKALEGASIDVQTEGWEFNTEAGMTLDPTENGEVYLPANTLKVRGARCRGGHNLVQRGTRLYSKGAHSYRIGSAVVMDLVVALPFEELPSSARGYVIAVAARRFGIPRSPSPASFRYTEDYLREMRTALESADVEMRDTTLPETSPHFAAMRRR